MKKVLRSVVALVLIVVFAVPVIALDGVWHDPYGMDDLYENQPTQRYPKDPAAGEIVYIKGTTWPVEPGQTLWVTYTKNGIAQQDVGAQWKYNEGNNSYWEAAIGPFAKGDVIEYYVHANKDGQNTNVIKLMA